jgi:hypothetical protein
MVLLAVTTLIVSISGRTLLDMALSYVSGPATIARWAQLSSLIDLASAVACAGLSPGVTVLVARASNLDVQSMILRTSVTLGFVCSALTLVGMIAVVTLVDFAGFQNLGAHIQVLNDPTLRWTVFLAGLFAATPVLAMQAWQSQGHPERSFWLTLAGSTMSVTAAVMSPHLLDANGLGIGTLAPLVVLLAAMTISVPLTVWYSSQSWRPMMHNSGQFKALLTFLPAGLSIGLLSPLSLIAARELMGVALGWDAVASVQAIWRCADWVGAFVSGMLSLVFLPRMSRAISACKFERESELGLKRGGCECTLARNWFCHTLVVDPCCRHSGRDDLGRAAVAGGVVWIVCRARSRGFCDFSGGGMVANGLLDSALRALCNRITAHHCSGRTVFAAALCGLALVTVVAAGEAVASRRGLGLLYCVRRLPGLQLLGDPARTL